MRLAGARPPGTRSLCSLITVGTVRKGGLPVGVALLALAGAIVAAVVMGSPATIRGPRAARAFLAAWEDSRQGTYAVEYRFTRVLADGRRFEGVTTLAQRPPDRLFVGLGTVDGTVDGKRVDCTTAPSGELRCFSGAPAGDYDDEVAAEIERLRPYVEGDNPLYRASWDGEACFALVLALDLPTAPYGTSARFCFDAATGAPTVTEVRKPEGTDTSEADHVRTEVTDADFERPGGAGELPGE